MRIKKKKRIIIKIAGIIFAVCSDRPTDSIHLDESYNGFLSTERPDVLIHTCYDDIPNMQLCDNDKAFDSGMAWSLYQTAGKNVFVLKSPTMGPLPYCIAIFDSAFRQGEVHYRYPQSRKRTDLLSSNPLQFPLSEVLMTCLLAQNRGIMVHACGIKDNGKGYLFAGNSAHGKTTMARLWKEKALVLNDDRIVLRQQKGRIWMYGTPWHGDYTGISAQGVHLDNIFFLNHAKSNEAVRKKNIDAVSMLLTRSFLPLWNAKGIRFTLDLGAQIVNNIPCYELGFVPDNNIVDFVRCVN